MKPRTIECRVESVREGVVITYATGERIPYDVEVTLRSAENEQFTGHLNVTLDQQPKVGDRFTVSITPEGEKTSEPIPLVALSGKTVENWMFFPGVRGPSGDYIMLGDRKFTPVDG